jgi:processive 1,2-diacylglycerol beta-glucosyltransferase
MSGSMGCGPIRKLVKLLSARLPENSYISVVCGTNNKLRKQLEREHTDHPRIRIYGFRKDISTMMDSADLYLTKPGGISTTEAAMKKLPMVFYNAVAGCETRNLHFFVDQGAAATADTPEELAELTLSLLSDAQQLSKMSAAFRKTIAKSPAEIICDYFMERTST